MPRLAVARDNEIEAIHRESHALWGAGLTSTDYMGLWGDVSRTRWAVKFAEFRVWVEGPRIVLSSMKVYRPRLRILGAESRSQVFGAIFTPRALRGCGHATRMVRSALDAADRAGTPFVLLFSDIGTHYYERFGFRSIRAEEQWGRVPAVAVPPGWTLRPMREEDLPSIRRFHEASSRSRTLAFVRDAEHWEFLRVRSRSFFRRLDADHVRQRWCVAELGGNAVGYLITVEARGEWNVREVGAADGDPSSMAAVLRIGAAAARSRGLRRFYGWLPPEVIAPLEDWGFRRQARRRALPMILPLSAGTDLEPLISGPDGYIPYQDQF